jgi:hypothetical protein
MIRGISISWISIPFLLYVALWSFTATALCSFIYIMSQYSLILMEKVKGVFGSFGFLLVGFRLIRKRLGTDGDGW